MEPFKVYEQLIAGRHYVLLPKLNSAQMGALAKRLNENGFVVQRSSLLSAKSPKGVIHVDPQGLCWSAFDPRDEIIPAVPVLLATVKERRSLREVMGLYFTAAKSKGKTTVRLIPRVESSTLWKALRASDQCGLTPDEYAVILLLVKKARGECRMLTDYPTEGSTMRVYGGRRYYESDIGPTEAGSTLRSVGQGASRNSYIPRDGVLTFEPFVLPSREEFTRLFRNLGEWCYFEPA